MQDFKQYKQGLIEIDKIKPYERNAKIHNSLQLEQIKNSILEFGFTNPLIVDSEFNLIAGHGRLEALKMLNRVEFKNNPIKEVNAVFIDGLSETQKRALIIADNKIAENSIWDDELLKSELIELDDLNFDLDLLGFNNDELKNIFSELKSLNNDFNLPKELEGIALEKDDFNKYENAETPRERVIISYNKKDENKILKLLNTNKIKVLYTLEELDNGIL